MVTRVRLFGRFRKYVGTDTHIEIELNDEMPVGEVKALIGEALRHRNSEFADDQLLADSVLADQHKVFTPEDRVPVGREVAILPPVCGG